MPALVNKKKKYVFVHIPKTAGRSVCDVLTNKGAVRALHKVHPTSTDLCVQYPPAEYFYFAFVRNPWDRIYSLYKFSEAKFNKRYKKSRFSSFDQFIQEGFSHNWHYVQSPKTPQTYWIEKNNIIIPHFIERFETLSKDLQIVSKEINVSFEKLGHAHKSSRLSNYQDAYNEEGRKLVEQYHKSDIDMFKYEF